MISSQAIICPIWCALKTVIISAVIIKQHFNRGRAKQTARNSKFPFPFLDRCNFDETFDDDFQIVKRKLFALKKESGWKGKISEDSVTVLLPSQNRGIQFVELIEVWSSLVSNWMPNYGLWPVDRTFIETLMFFRSTDRYRAIRTRDVTCVLRNSI